MLVFAACEPGVDIEAEIRDRATTEAVEMAERAVDALGTFDAQTIAGFGSVNGGADIQRLGARAMRRGRISSMGTELLGPPELVEMERVNDNWHVALDAPYRITWESEASDAPYEAEGEFRMEFIVSEDDHEGEGEWRIALGSEHLFPSHEDARGFSVEYKWPKRAPIVDREGRKIALGPAEGRRYPFGTLAGTTVGHVGTLTKKDIRGGAIGEVGDLVGASGLEEAFQDRLAGEPSSKVRLIDADGGSLAVVGRKDGVKPEKVKVSLDMEIQRRAEAAYSGIGGAVVMDPSSGDILAAVDSSTFDPNNYVGAASVDPFNRALSGGYPPGSSMKVVTAAAALDTGTVTPTTTVTGPKEYQGVRNFESGEFGSIPFSTAVKFSVNTAFAQVAQDLGSKRLTRYAEAFGFNHEPEMALEARTSSFPDPVGLGDLMWSSVGQAQVIATPLQMASVVATIANGGKRMEPRIDLSLPKDGVRVVSRKTAGQLAEMMRAAVEGGTGTNARIAGVAVAGKTGTAEVDVDGERKNHAWFVCFAPVGKAELAIAVVSEYGGIGGQVAAPMARAIMVGALPLAP